jgi:hypothetical protein
MRLAPPEIESHMLHTEARNGTHLGVMIRFSHKHPNTPGLRFQYTIDGEKTWRPLNRSTPIPSRVWTAVIYGVKSGDKVQIRTLVGEEEGEAHAVFVVRPGVDASTDRLRGFVPRAPEEGIRPTSWRRAPRRRVASRSDVYFTTGWSQAYHSSPDCAALRSGQRGVEWRGGDPAMILNDSMTGAEFEGKRPCRVCRPS